MLKLALLETTIFFHKFLTLEEVLALKNKNLRQVYFAILIIATE